MAVFNFTGHVVKRSAILCQRLAIYRISNASIEHTNASMTTDTPPPPLPLPHLPPTTTVISTSTGVDLSKYSGQTKILGGKVVMADENMYATTFLNYWGQAPGLPPKSTPILLLQVLLLHD